MAYEEDATLATEKMNVSLVSDKPGGKAFFASFTFFWRGGEIRVYMPHQPSAAEKRLLWTGDRGKRQQRNTDNDESATAKERSSITTGKTHTQAKKKRKSTREKAVLPRRT